MTVDPLLRYTTTAGRSAGVVITSYSTSFGLACHFLPAGPRRDIENIYALVRIADEAVDGAAEAAGLTTDAVGAQLDRLERETEDALESGYSTNMVVHAFAETARRTGIGMALTRPFFASMRTDLYRRTHDEQSLATYIYGSAEVVGLMCLRVFVAMPGTCADHPLQLQESARRLGSAFQKINFLRDMAADTGDLGRQYFPGFDPATFNDAQKQVLLADIRADLAEARAGMVCLAPSARRAVHLSYELFSALTAKLERIPAAELMTGRTRVPGLLKAAIACRVMAGGRIRRRKEPSAVANVGKMTL